MSPPHCARLALNLGAALLSVVALTLVSATGMLLMGGSVHSSAFPMAAVATAAWVIPWLLHTERESGRRMIAMVLGAATVVVIAAMIIAPLVLDATYDGQWYHQEAVLQLASGWNPVAGDLTPAEVADLQALARINGHAKGSWICGSSLYQLTGRIEHNKAFSLVLLVAAGCLTFAALTWSEDFTRIQATLVAAVITCNPVAITQVLNAQVDGDLASVLLIIIASLVVYARSRSTLALLALATALMVAFGLKITAPLVCAGVAAAGIVFVIASRAPLRPVLVSLFLGVSVGLVGTPFAPYVTNTLRHGHPLYPAMGPQSVGMIDAPPHGRLRTLATSIFSRSCQFQTTREAVHHLLGGHGLKLPGTFDREEIKVFAMPDVRVGGFGPLFGAVLLLTTAASIAVGRRRLALAVFMVGPIVTTVLIFPIPWMARLVPQFWLVPMIVLPLTLKSRRLPARVLGWLAVAAASANLILIIVGHLYGVLPHSTLMRTRISDLARPGAEIQVHLGRYPSNRARLAELGVRFTQVGDRHFDLGTYLGWPKAHVLTLEPSNRNGESVITLELARLDTATSHTVTVIPMSDGRRAGADEHHLVGFRGEIPVPRGGYLLEIAVCNALGCGPPLTMGATKSHKVE